MTEALVGMAMALATAVVASVLVALFFRVGLRGILAVVAASLITSPLLNLSLGALTFQAMASATSSPSSTVFFAVLIALEVLVVLAEWRMLVWALRRTAGSSAKLLVLSVVMNVVSALSTIVVTLAVTFIGLATRGA